MVTPPSPHDPPFTQSFATKSLIFRAQLRTSRACSFLSFKNGGRNHFSAVLSLLFFPLNPVQVSSATIPQLATSNSGSSLSPSPQYHPHPKNVTRDFPNHSAPALQSTLYRLFSAPFQRACGTSPDYTVIRSVPPSNPFVDHNIPVRVSSAHELLCDASMSSGDRHS